MHRTWHSSLIGQTRRPATDSAVSEEFEQSWMGPIGRDPFRRSRFRRDPRDRSSVHGPAQNTRPRLSLERDFFRSENVLPRCGLAKTDREFSDALSSAVAIGSENDRCNVDVERNRRQAMTRPASRDFAIATEPWLFTVKPGRRGALLIKRDATRRTDEAKTGFDDPRGSTARTWKTAGISVNDSLTSN